MAHYAALTAINRLRHLGVGKVELRQAGVALPVKRTAIRVEIKPATIGRIRVVASAAVALLVTIKPRVGIAGMVKYPVEYQFHPHLVSAHSQTLQGDVAAQIGST